MSPIPGVWNYMESLVREWAQTYGTIYVIAGSVLDSDNDGRGTAMRLPGVGSNIMIVMNLACHTCI